MDATLETFRILLDEGFSCKRIAKALNMGYFKVYRRLRSEGMMREKPRLPSEIREKIIAEIRLGRSYSEIARRFLTNPSTVLRIARRLEEDAESASEWRGDNQLELDVVTLRKPRRCPECGRPVLTEPCIACAAIKIAKRNG
jgi:transposase